MFLYIYVLNWGFSLLFVSVEVCFVDWTVMFLFGGYSICEIGKDAAGVAGIFPPSASGVIYSGYIDLKPKEKTLLFRWDKI